MPTELPIRAGIIGCGKQGKRLARAAAQIPSLQVVACADPNMQAAQQAAAYSPQAKLYTTPEELIGQDDLDAIFVATPHHLLQPYALLAVKAGKHVLAEKPIALNAVEAAQLEDAVRESGVTFMSGYSFRYFPEPRQAYELLCAGATGEIEAISAGIGVSPLSGGWMVDPKAGGGVMLFLGCHLVDQILWYMADHPVEVYANVRYHSASGIDATSAFQIRFSRGAVAHCMVTDAADSLFYNLHLVGRTGRLDLSFSNTPKYVLTVQSQTLPEYSEPKSSSSMADVDSDVQGKLKAELTDFAEAIAAGRQAPITVQDGRKVLAVLDAVTESGRTGRPILLDA